MYVNNRDSNSLAMTERPLFRYMFSALVLTVIFAAAVKFMDKLYDDAAQFEFELLSDRLTSSVNFVHRSWLSRGRPSRMHLMFNVEQTESKRLLIQVNRFGWPINVDANKHELNCENVWRYLAKTIEENEMAESGVKVETKQTEGRCLYQRLDYTGLKQIIVYDPDMGKVSLVI